MEVDDLSGVDTEIDESPVDMEVEYVSGVDNEMDDAVAGEVTQEAPPSPPLPPAPPLPKNPKLSWALMTARRYTMAEMENQPCRFHITPKNPARHLLKDCYWWKAHGGSKVPEPEDDSDDESEDEATVLTDDLAALHIFTTIDKKEAKRIDQAISCSDQSRKCGTPGNIA